ncbi:MAG: hypothetical protein FLDDKLPJ_01613 [Phycisphaerae bacterium]|nr:hypothetical protein [Phycisphaerae bacterium]
MNATFLDTSYLLAIVNQEDELHARALAWKNRIRGRLLTTDFVLLEFVDALCRPALRHRAMDVVVVLRADADITILPLSTTLMDEGLSLFGAHHDKHWSLTDCISFHVMKREQITEALTADRHFEQAGFRALLRSDPPSGS